MAENPTDYFDRSESPNVHYLSSTSYNVRLKTTENRYTYLKIITCTPIGQGGDNCSIPTFNCHFALLVALTLLYRCAVIHFRCAFHSCERILVLSVIVKLVEIMNSNANGIVHRRTNPREEANIFSLCFFTHVKIVDIYISWISKLRDWYINFAFPIVWKGIKSEFQEEDIYEVQKNHESCRLGDMVESKWEKQNNKQRWHFLRVLLRLFYVDFLLISALDGFVISSIV